MFEYYIYFIICTLAKHCYIDKFLFSLFFITQIAQKLPNWLLTNFQKEYILIIWQKIDKFGVSNLF